VPEEASLTVRAKQFLSKSVTGLRLVLCVTRGLLAHQLMITMGKLAFIAVSAVTHFYPVFAHLSFVLGLVSS